GPGSFIEPPPPGAVPLGAPGAPVVPVEAPGATVGEVLGEVLGGAFTILTMGALIPGDTRLHSVGPDGDTTNTKGMPYPHWLDPRTGKPVPFPEGSLKIVPSDKRVKREDHQKNKFITEWLDRGYPRDPNNWDDLEIHHIKPLERGGTNDFWNLVPLPTGVHKQFSKYWKDY